MSNIPIESLANRIYLLRGQKVMLDSDLAGLYGVTTSALNQQVKRNASRVPEDFAFQLTEDEYSRLLSQIVIAKPPLSVSESSSLGKKAALKSQIVTAKRGGRRSPPMAFTEQGVAMLSSVLNSDRAAQVNVAIMRTSVRLRDLLAGDRELARKVEEHDRKITILISTVQDMLALPAPTEKKIGFAPPSKAQARN